MYESFFKEVESSLKPALDVAEVNRRVLEKLASNQTDYLNECIEASVKQFQALSQASDPQTATELQIKFFKDFECKLANTAEQNVATLSRASEELQSIFDQNFHTLSKLHPVDLDEWLSTWKLDELTKFNPIADLFKGAEKATAKAEVKAEPKAAPQAEPKAEPKAESKAEPKAETKVEAAPKKAPVRRAAAKKSPSKSAPVKTAAPKKQAQAPKTAQPAPSAAKASTAPKAAASSASTAAKPTTKA